MGRGTEARHRKARSHSMEMVPTEDLDDVDEGVSPAVPLTREESGGSHRSKSATHGEPTARLDADVESGSSDESERHHATRAQHDDLNKSHDQPVKPAITPLPKLQCAIVLVVQFCEGYQVTMLFPFVVFMMRDFGIPEAQTGVYAGALTAAFCAAQFCSSFAWGYLSDRFGRKAALFSGVVGTGIASLVFGTSVHYAQAVVGRVLGGLLNGNIGVLKAFLSDITDDTNRTQGFALMSFSWGLGAVVGPVAGGYLSNLAYDVDLLHQFPYLVPCALGSILQGIGAILILFVMVEPNHDYDKLQTADTVAASDADADAAGDDASDEEGGVTVAAHRDDNTQSVRAVLCRKKAIVSSGLYLVACMAFIVFDEALPLFMATAVDFGGLGFSDHEIGSVLMVNGGTLLFFTLWVLPALARRTSLKFLMRVGFLGSMLACLPPIANAFVLTSRGAAYFVMGVIMVAKACFGSCIFTGSSVLVNNSVPPRHVGVMNGVAQSFAALCRSIGPALAGALWSWSEHMDVIGHTYIVFSFAGAVLAFGLWLTRHMSDDMEVTHRDNSSVSHSVSE